jgi:hypothetical protein
MSSSPFISSAVLPSTDSPADDLQQHLSALYALSQDNPHVFASPLGPLAYGGRNAWLPRFVFFGPNTTNESWRLAFLAGFDRSDLRGTRALLGLIESLSAHSEDGYGLNLTFFPLIDVAGVAFRAPSRPLTAAHWGRSDAPEIALLERDARAVGYHGYIRIETGSLCDDMIGLRMRAPDGLAASPDVELVSSDDFESYPVRFERGHSAASDGPLSIAADLPVQPFELTLRIPGAWSDVDYRRAVNFVLGRFILRYRAFQAYAQHL